MPSSGEDLSRMTEKQLKFQLIYMCIIEVYMWNTIQIQSISSLTF